jgi:MFS family permease
LFHGWRIVGVAALAQGVSVGSTFYAYGAFLKPLAAEFGASRLAVTLGLTLLTLVQAAAAPVVGRALDRRSPRALMIAGVVVQAVGLVALSRVTAFWQAALVFVTAISLGSTLFGPLATATVVAKWFVRQRGRALGITALGAAIGGGIFPLLATALIERLGWRGALAAMGSGLLLMIVPLAGVLVRRPEDIGSTPDGLPVPDGASPELVDETSTTSTTSALLRDRDFWAITIAIGCAFCPIGVLLAHLVPYATDLGISPGRAAVVMSSYAFASGVGRVLFGTLADRMDKRLVCWIAFGCLGLAWSSLLGRPSFGALVATGVAAGVAMGGIVPLWGALAGATFGRASFGRVMGLMNLLMIPFSISGAPVAAYLFDRTGSYQLAFASFLSFFVLAAIAIAFLRIPSFEPGAASDAV